MVRIVQHSSCVFQAPIRSSRRILRVSLKDSRIVRHDSIVDLRVCALGCFMDFVLVGAIGDELDYLHVKKLMVKATQC